MLKRRVEVGLRNPRGESPQAASCGIFLREKCTPRGVLYTVHEMPVIEPSATPRFLVHVEANRMDDVETCAERGGGSPDVPRVVRDFGVEENDVQKGPQRSPPQFKWAKIS